MTGWTIAWIIVGIIYIAGTIFTAATGYSTYQTATRQLDHVAKNYPTPGPSLQQMIRRDHKDKALGRDMFIWSPFWPVVAAMAVVDFVANIVDMIKDKDAQ